MNDCIERLTVLLNEVLNGSRPALSADDLNEEAKLREDLGLNSITMLMLVMNIEEEFDIEFPTDRQYTTVGDVIAAIEEG